MNWQAEDYSCFVPKNVTWFTCLVSWTTDFLNSFCLLMIFLPRTAGLILEHAQRIFVQASPETILYDASAAEKIHQAKSTTRGFVTKLQPFVEAVEQYGTALDVYSNIYPLVMGPLWGSVRVVLHV